MNYARAVRISGDGSQEGRHLAKKEEGYGTRNKLSGIVNDPLTTSGKGSSRTVQALNMGDRQPRIPRPLERIAGRRNSVPYL